MQNALAADAGPLETAYPPDPTANIPWTVGMSGVTDIQSAFNQARAAENSQLGTSLPMLTLPSQTEWNGMSDAEKGLWLINRERIDRGLAPLHGVETNVQSVAQYYADYLLDNNLWGHSADGRSPWDRMNDRPAIGACHDFLSVGEIWAVFVTSGSSIPLPIERSIYMWMYEDALRLGTPPCHPVDALYRQQRPLLGREGNSWVSAGRGATPIRGHSPSPGHSRK